MANHIMGLKCGVLPRDQVFDDPEQAAPLRLRRHVAERLPREMQAFLMEPNIKAAWHDPSTTNRAFPDVSNNTSCCAFGNAAI